MTKPPLRPSIALGRHHQANRPLLSLEKSDLASSIAHRGDPLRELRRAARSANDLVRRRYADLIHNVGRNVFPLIVFTDHEQDGPCGVGSTLTLYRDDGSVTKVSPALSSNYELYKACSHLFMGLGVEVGPYLENATVCRGDIAVDGDIAADGDLRAEEDREEPGWASPSESLSSELSAVAACSDESWRASLTGYLQGVRAFRQAMIHALEAGVAAEEMGKLEIGSGGIKKKRKNNSSLALPPPDMQETMTAMFNSVIEFCDASLSCGFIDVRRWKRLNQENFPRIKQCMKAATKAQADACIAQIVEWKDMMGPEEWRDLYVVIPTVWAVGAENPRKTMFQHLMDEDRVDTHIIQSEWPRDHGEARTLLGRVVADRSIGRFVFGDETEEQQVKTMGLSSQVDVVQDDALPAIWDALGRHSCPVRHGRSSEASRRSPRVSVDSGEEAVDLAPRRNPKRHTSCLGGPGVHRRCRRAIAMGLDLGGIDEARVGRSEEVTE